MLKIKAYLLTLCFLGFKFVHAQCTGANMSTPIIVGSVSPPYTYSNTQNNSNSCFGNDIGHTSNDIYYRITIAAPSIMLVSTCGSGFDTYLHVLDANGVSLATNDDNGPSCTGNNASLMYSVSPGTYYVVSEGYSTNTGNITTMISLSTNSGGGSSSSWSTSGSNIYSANSGNVGIGISSPQAKLAVNGDVMAKKVKVTVTGWPDYVFSEFYDLLSLDSVASYIKKYKHLPGISPASDIELNGLDLGLNQSALLEKVEELFLHLISQKRIIAEEKRKNSDLEHRLAELEQLVKIMQSKYNSLEREHR